MNYRDRKMGCTGFGEILFCCSFFLDCSVCPPLRKSTQPPAPSLRTYFMHRPLSALPAPLLLGPPLVGHGDRVVVLLLTVVVLQLCRVPLALLLLLPLAVHHPAAHLVRVENRHLAHVLQKDFICLFTPFTTSVKLSCLILDLSSAFRPAPFTPQFVSNVINGSP